MNYDMSDKNESFRNKVLKVRKEKNITQNQLMHFTGLSPRTLRSIEQNTNTFINKEHFMKIAKALEVEYNDLFEEPADRKLKKLQIEDYEKVVYETFLNLDFVRALVEEIVVKTEKNQQAISNILEEMKWISKEIKNMRQNAQSQNNPRNRAGKRYSKFKKR